MARVAIIYGSSEGHTARLAERMAEVMAAAGHTPEVAAAAKAPAPNGYDALVVASSIHVGHYHQAVRRYLRDHLPALAAMPHAFVSVSLSEASPGASGAETVAGYLHTLREETGFEPARAVSFGGALAFRRYGVLTRLMLRRIAAHGGLATDTSTNHDYTDWAAVDAFAASFASELERAEAPGTPAR